MGEIRSQLAEDMDSEDLRDILNFDALQTAVIDWGVDKGILGEGAKSDVKSQCLKTMSEAGELADGVAKGDMDEVRDAIGDVLVTLIILAKQYRDLGEDVDLEDCLQGAYNIIAKRTGRMINGVFVKSADLKD